MQIELDNLYREARVWINTLPPVLKSKYEKLAYIAPAETVEGLNYLCKAGVELSIYTGPRYIYGLVGATFWPNKNNELYIEVHVRDESNNVIKDTLGTDIVYEGLPTDYVESLVKSIILNKDLIGSGKLYIHTSGHTLEGSNQRIFEKLGAILMRVMTLGNTELTEEELKLLIKES